MNGYAAVSEILKREGTEWLACFPDNALIDAVSNVGIRPITFRQERGGIMAADGYSRMLASQGKYGVFCCQHGPGSENAFGGIAQAWGDAVPILFLADGYPTIRGSVKPTFSSSRNFEKIVKFSATLTNIDHLVPLMRRAMVSLRNGRPGPVLLELPRDIMPQEVTNLDTYRVSKSYATAPSPSSVKDTVRELLKAKNPVIWAGQGVLYADGSKLLTRLAEITKTPVITTMPGKSAIDERHPLSLGATNKTAPKAVWKWLKESDMLLAIGASLTKTGYGIDVPGEKFIVHNTNNVDDIGKEYPTDIGLVGDANATLKMLVDAVQEEIGDKVPSNRVGVEQSISETKRSWLEEWSATLGDNSTPINPYRLVAEINRAVDHENTVLTHDAGHPRDQIMPFYTATSPKSYVGWGKTTHLGYGLPMMIGVKLARPDKFCVNFMGDAAFGMSGLDIETAVRSGNPTTTILLNNGTMGGYDKRMPSAMDLYGAGRMGGDYAKIAEGLGGVGIKVSEPHEVGPAVKRAAHINEKEGKSVLIDVATRTESRMSVY